MKETKSVMRLAKQLTPEQKEDIMVLAEECKKLGATTKQLAPFYAIFLINTSPKPTEKEKKYAMNLGVGVSFKI